MMRFSYHTVQSVTVYRNTLAPLLCINIMKWTFYGVYIHYDMGILCVDALQVIYALTAHLKKTHTDAVALATFVDRKVDTVQFLGVLSGECVCFILSLWYMYLYPLPPFLKGRAVCKVGTKEVCLQSKELINVRERCTVLYYI